MKLILYFLWQLVKQYRATIAFFAIALIVIIALIIIGYSNNSTGFNGYPIITTSKTTNGITPPTITTTVEHQPGKTLWDWMQLLIVPIVLAVGGFWLNQIQKSREQRSTQQQADRELLLAHDNQQEALLQAYIDKMEELLFDRQLDESKPEDKVRKLARVRSISVLSRLNSERKGSVLKFLHESGLIQGAAPIIDLQGIDLSKAKLRNIKLSNANLSGADLTGVNLSRADLAGANLSKAVLFGSDLWGINLMGANLKEASISLHYYVGADPNNTNLGNANLSKAGLIGVVLNGADLTGANLKESTLVGAALRETLFIRADLTDADLNGADLTGANFTDAKVTEEQLNKAATLELATMPDGSKHP